jgi:hypothetical protein
MLKMRCNLFMWLACCMPFGVTAMVTSTWNGTSWVGGTPNNTIDAIIASSTTPGAFTCANLTINSGVALTINSGVTVTIAGNITNNGSGLAGLGTIQFNKSGSTVTLSGNVISFGGIVDVVSGTTLSTNDKLTLSATSTTSFGRISGSTGTITGNVTVNKVLANTTAGWRQISLPVDAPITSLTGLDLLTSSHPTSFQRNVFYWDPSNAGASIAAGWAVAAGTDDETKAYAIYSNNSNNGLHDITSGISITGTPNQSDYVVSLQYNFDPSGNHTASNSRGWYFIPNRFPSLLDISVLVNDANFGSTYKAVHVYNEVTGQYVAINQSTMNTYNCSTSFPIATTDIIPFQGFWVKATSTSQSITVKNIHRITDLTTATAFAKLKHELMRLNVSDSAGRGDQVVVFFDAQATEQLDGTMDLFKLKSPNNTVPTLFCQEGDLELCTDALPMLNGTRTIQLMFESQKIGSTYTFSPDFSAFNKYASVILEDRKTGVLHDLSNGPYQFVYDGSFGSDRFVLHFDQKNTEAGNPANTGTHAVAINKTNPIHHSK